MNFKTPYNTEDFFYTKEDDLMLFNSPLENTYFEMTVNITSYEFYTDEAKATTLEYKIPLFNNRAEFLLGEIIDRSMPRMKGINLRSLYQYKAAIVTINVKEIDDVTDTAISETILGPIKFVSGFRPKTVENNCAFLEIFDLPRSVTARGFGFVNMLLPTGTHTFKVLKNKEQVDSFNIIIVSGNIVSRGLKMDKYQCAEGDIIECIMPANPTLNKSFYVLPDGFFTNYIAFEDEYRLKTIIEFSGEYKFPMEFDSKINKVQHLSVYKNNKVSSEKSATLTINTGFLLEEEEVMIESLLDSKRAWLIIGENKGIELVPNTKKFVSMSSGREYYEYDIDFSINLNNKKPLHLALNQPLIILEVDDIPPTAPSNLTNSSTTTTSTKLSWESSTDISGIGAYDVYKNGYYYGSSNTNSIVIKDLSPSVSYSFFVKARDLSGNISDSSATLIVVTPAGQDITPPTAPTNLIVSLLTPNSLRLTWAASTDNIGILRYNIYKNGTKIGFSSSVTYDVSGLSPNTLYSFYVIAEDTSGNFSAVSTAIEPTTLSVYLIGFYMASSGHPLEFNACKLTNSSAYRYHTGGDTYPYEGDTVFSDSEGYNLFIGFNRKYAMANNNWALINDFGVVTLIGSC